MRYTADFSGLRTLKRRTLLIYRIPLPWPGAPGAGWGQDVACELGRRLGTGCGL